MEIVHESLLKAWPRLVRWQTQDEDSVQLRDQLKQAAHLWDERGRSPDVLWSGTALREYELWRERYGGHLTALEESFAGAMLERVTPLLDMTDGGSAKVSQGVAMLGKTPFYKGVTGPYAYRQNLPALQKRDRPVV